MKLNDWRVENSEQMGQPSRVSVAIDMTYDPEDPLAKRFLKIMTALRTADDSVIDEPEAESEPETTKEKGKK